MSSDNALSRARQKLTPLMTDVSPEISPKLRLVTLIMALGAVAVLIGSNIRMGQDLKAARDGDLQTLAATAETNGAQLDRRLDVAATALRAGARLSADAADEALRLSGGTLAGVAIVSLDNRILSTSGDDDRDLILKAANDARAHARLGERLMLGAYASRLSPTPRTYLVLSGAREDAVMVGRLADPLAGLSLPDKGVAVLMSDGGQVLAATRPGLAGKDVKAALALNAREVREHALSGEPLGGALEEGGFQRAVAVRHPSLDAISLTLQPAGGATGTGDLWRTLILIGGPLLIGALFSAALLLQHRQTRARAQKYQDTESRYRIAVESARCGIWEWDLATSRVELSDVSATMLGFGGQPGMWPAEAVLARLMPEHSTLLINAFEKARIKGTMDVTICAYGVEDRPIWLALHGEAVGDRAPEGFLRLSGVMLDVTAERLAHMRAQRAQTQLRDVINTASDGFVQWDRRQRLVLWNRTFADLFAVDPDVLKLGTSRDLVEQVMQIAVRRAGAAEDGTPGVIEAELNDHRWLRIVETRTRDGGTFVAFTDVTAAKTAETHRRQHAEKLEEKVNELKKANAEKAELAAKYQQAMIEAESANHSKSQFLANMSHELRTPLNAINGFSEIMASEMFGPLGDARYREYSGDILSSGQHLLSLINDILDMSKIEAGKMTLYVEPTQMHEVIDDALRVIRQRAEKAGLKLRTHLPVLPDIEADYRKIKQVLLNLLTNAVKFTPAGGTVTIAAAVTDSHLHLQVRDTGIGIDKKDLDRLTRPFEQIENQMQKTREGTGLGLALSRSLVELHHGRFEVDSELGRGTTVTVILPLRQPVSATPEATGTRGAA